MRGKAGHLTSSLLLEMDRVGQILDIDLNGNQNLSNQEVKMMLLKALAFPLQSVCQ